MCEWWGSVRYQAKHWKRPTQFNSEKNIPELTAAGSSEVLGDIHQRPDYVPRARRRVPESMLLWGGGALDQVALWVLFDSKTL
jgi:hypothetical protein